MNATISPDHTDTKNIKAPAPSNSAPAEPAGGSAPPAADRDSRGRFVAGNKSGHGNPFARRTARLRSFLLEAVTDGDMQILAQRLVERAKGGDTGALPTISSKSQNSRDRPPRDGHGCGAGPTLGPQRTVLRKESLRQCAPCRASIGIL